MTDDASDWSGRARPALLSPSMTRLKLRLMGLVFDVLVIVAGVLLTFAFTPHTYQAEATVFVSASKPGPFEPTGPDTSAFMPEVRDLFRQSGAEDHGAELVQRRHGMPIVVAHDRDRGQAARLANQAVSDLSTEAQKDPRTVEGWTVEPQLFQPAVPPPAESRLPLLVGAGVALAAAAGTAVGAHRMTIYAKWG